MVMDGEGELDRRELDFFLKGDTSLDEPEVPCPHDWISAQGWKDLIRLEDLLEDSPDGSANPFSGIVDSVTKADTAGTWKSWYDLSDPERSPVPAGYEDKLSRF